MKTRSMLTIAAVLVAVLFAAWPASAAPAVRVQIPFEFTVANVVMPAGLYNIRYTDAPGQLFIRQVDGDATAYVTSIKTGKTGPVDDESARLLFRQYAGRYFLNQLSVPGYPVSKVNPSKVEKEMIARANQALSRTLMAELVRK